MNLKIDNKEVFCNNFVSNLSRIVDNGVLKIERDKISCTTSTADNTIIVYCQYTNAGKFHDEDKTVSLNIPDFKKFSKLLGAISGEIDLEVDANSINYNSDIVRFKFHLFEDGILSSPKISMDKISKISFDYGFTISSEALANLMRGSALLADLNKIYFNIIGNKVYGEVTDKARHNVDSFSTCISNDFSNSGTSISGFAKVIPLNIEIVRILGSSKCPKFDVKYSSQFNVLTFDASINNLFTRYVVSALVN